MKTKNIQDVVAGKVERIIEHFNNQFTDQDDGTFSVGLDTRYATKEDFVEFIRANLTQLVKEVKEGAYEEAIKLSDEIEMAEPDGGTSQWIAFKKFRNTMRDHLTTLEQSLQDKK